MGRFPGSPRTLRGAIVAVDPLSPLSRIVVFQYNPDTVTRSLTPRAAGGSGTPGPAADVHRIWGAPQETITMTVELDATDGLEAGDPVATSAGVLPQISALEMLLHPSVAQVIMNTGLLLAGTIEVLPPEAPLTVLVWGPGRAVPVSVQSLSITEQAFDVTLAPIRATVEVTMRVLTYSDLPATDPGFALFLVHQVLKEATASIAGATGAAAATMELGS